MAKKFAVMSFGILCLTITLLFIRTTFLANAEAGTPEFVELEVAGGRSLYALTQDGDLYRTDGTKEFSYVGNFVRDSAKADQE